MGWRGCLLSVCIGVHLWLLSNSIHAAWPPPGRAVRVEIGRDTWVSSAGREGVANNGGSARLKTKGVQEFPILDFDPGPLSRRVITGATLHLRSVSKDPQRRLSVSSLASDWVEGTGASYQTQKGSACFKWAALESRPWAFAGSDITAVCFGQGNTIWRFAEATPPDAEGWQVVAVEPGVIAARVAGLSYGLVVMDDVGSEYERDGEKFTYHQFPNRFVASRESGKKSAPYLTVYLGPQDAQPPQPVGAITQLAAELPACEAMLTWATPPDAGPAGTLGFLARYSKGSAFDWDSATPIPQYLVPLASARPVTMHLRDLSLAGGSAITVGLRAVDAAGNVSPVTTVSITLSAPARLDLKPAPVKPFDKLAALPSVGPIQVAIIDALDKVHPVTGQLIPKHPDTYLQANHLWSAAEKTIRLHAARNEFVDFQIVLRGRHEAISAELRFDDPSISSQLLRLRHVGTKTGPLPDPLVPLSGALAIPAGDEKIPDQKAASLLAEHYVSHDAAPGLHAGTLTLKAGDASLALRVELRVWDFVLPDRLSFLPEMNCYSLPDPPDDLAYYRLAHRHRTCLNRLGYSWRGTVNPSAAPKWTGQDFDWAAWDRHYAPVLDGSAFADLPRKSVPVEAFYLQLNENWPIDINKHFKGGYWADEAFDPAYRQQLADAFAKVAAHINGKKWHDTFFEFYLNNKVYYKKDAWSKSSAPWILDEPMNTQDFWALRFYGLIFHEGIAAHRGGAKLAYRCDISRPQWQRDILDGLLDVNIVGGAFRNHQRIVLDRKGRNGELAINYGSSNPIDASNVQPAAWCIETYLAGLDGVLPWQTVGRDSSWVEGDELSLFYPGRPVGQAEPLASVRLKAYRRGQQDVEYLVMLSQMTRTPRFALAEAVKEALDLSAKFQQRSAEDAGFIDYGAIDPAALWLLRLRLGTMLNDLKPPSKPQWIEFRTPPRNLQGLPATGYVSVAPR